MKRLSSCANGLDRLIGGGFPENDVILLSGGSGSGKTIFGLQFVCTPKSEPGLYITFEDEPLEIRSIADSFGWDINLEEEKGRVRVVKFDPFQLEDVMDLIQNNIREMGASRVVIDSISSLGTYTNETSELRRNILLIKEIMKKNKCTTVMISETPGSGISRFGVEEFIADGVIALRSILFRGEYRRGLNIVKMRGTQHSSRLHQYEITGKGFSVSQKTLYA